MVLRLAGRSIVEVVPAANGAGAAQVEGSLRVFRQRGQGTPLFGSVMQEGRSLRFVAAAPWMAGVSYIAVFDPRGGATLAVAEASQIPSATEVRGSGRLVLAFELPGEGKPGTLPGLRIYPAGVTVPANHLKVYLQFTEPMEQGVALEKVSLHTVNGKRVSGAFRETELWSPDGKRLTLWLHPGRQKTGVSLNEEEGAVLEAGKAYELSVSKSWRSVAGRSLAADAVWRFKAAEADHSRVALADWKLILPKSARDSVTIEFTEGLDHAMLQSAIAVEAAGFQNESRGEVMVSDDGLQWSFRPAKPWTPGLWRLRVNPLLEDLAGNNLERAFEEDVQNPSPGSRPKTTTTLEFVIPDGLPPGQ